MKKKGDGAGATRLRLLEETELDVRSASAIAPLGEGAALVVDDDEGIYLVDARGGARLLRGRKDAKALGDLEGLCVSDDGATAYAVSEEKGRVFAFDVVRDGASVTLSDPVALGVLERPGDVKNKGWEGVAYLPAGRGEGACLVVVHERKPMAVGVFALPDLRRVAEVELDGAFERSMEDVSDVAVCPVTGHLFLLSDESRCVVEARPAEDWGTLEHLGVIDLDLGDEKPEGIAFESDDRLVITTDATQRLLRFAVERPRPSR